MWRAPLESYGVLWEFMGGIDHINFLVRRSQWALWAAVLSSAGVGEGSKSRITVDHCSRQCTQNVTKDWPCQMLRANASAFKRRAHGLGLQSKDQSWAVGLLVLRKFQADQMSPSSYLVSWSSYTPSDLASLRTSAHPDDANACRLSADPPLHLAIRSFLEWASVAVFLHGTSLAFTVGIMPFCRYNRLIKVQGLT